MDNIKPSTIDGVHTNRWDPRLNYAGSMWIVWIWIVYWWNAKLTILHQGLWLGESVPSSHKRGELRYAIIWQFRGRNQGSREVIPVPDSLGEEAILIDIFTGWRYLKGQMKWLHISAIFALKPIEHLVFQRPGLAGISTPWPFRYPQPVKMSIFKSIASSPRLSMTGMTSLDPWFLPLNCQMIAYLSSPLLWELGTNSPSHSPWWRIVNLAFHQKTIQIQTIHMDPA